ncbi:DUF4232 domain-containing protein [Streptomyces sp. NPDC002573]|uniref:DUF4232 domain-containing protein n=1 Tax=Streptomyces sp. NPDC002573 TaxID=3364651 RepID=UPI0036B7A3FF
MVGMALTACGHTAAQDKTTKPVTSSVSASATASAAQPPAGKPAECRTKSLAWKLVLLPAKGSSRRDARLTAANPASRPCVFAGYPGVLIHNGKANSLEGVGHGHPKTVTLHKGAKVTVDLQYTPRGAKSAGDYCVTTDEVLVSAPHNPDDDRANIRVVDAHDRFAVIDACGESISMSLPH